MRRKVVIILTILILFVIMLIPIKYVLKDGGTTVYKSILYSITKYHELYTIEINGEEQINYKEGTTIKILGIQVYSDFNESDDSLNNINDITKVDYSFINYVLKGKNGSYLFVDSITDDEISEMMKVLYPNGILDWQGQEIGAVDDYENVYINFLNEHINAYTLKDGETVKVDLEPFNLIIDDGQYGENEILFYKAIVNDDVYVFPARWNGYNVDFIHISEENLYYFVSHYGIWQINLNDLKAYKITTDEYEGKTYDDLVNEYAENDFGAPLIWIDNVCLSPNKDYIIYSTNRDCENMNEQSIWKINLKTGVEERAIEPESSEYIEGFTTNEHIIIGKSRIANINDSSIIKLEIPQLSNLMTRGIANRKLVYSTYEDSDPMSTLVINEVNVNNGMLTEIQRFVNCRTDIAIFCEDSSKMAIKYGENVEKASNNILLYNFYNNTYHFLNEIVDIEENDVIRAGNIFWLNNNLLVIKFDNGKKQKTVLFNVASNKVIREDVKYISSEM